MRPKGGEAVSDEVRVVTDESNSTYQILIEGYPINRDKIYTVSTIDYLAWGNDYLDALKRGAIVWSDDVEMSAPVLQYIKEQDEYGLPFNPDPVNRFVMKR